MRADSLNRNDDKTYIASPPRTQNYLVYLPEEARDQPEVGVFLYDNGGREERSWKRGCVRRSGVTRE